MSHLPLLNLRPVEAASIREHLRAAIQAAGILPLCGAMVLVLPEGAVLPLRASDVLTLAGETLEIQGEPEAVAGEIYDQLEPRPA